MPPTTLVTAALVLLTVMAGPRDQTPAPPKPAVVAGRWTMALDMALGVAAPRLVLAQDDTALTGTYAGRYGAVPLTGTVRGGHIEFAVTMRAEGQQVDMTFTGDVAADGQSMKGLATLGPMGEASWSATRDPVR